MTLRLWSSAECYWQRTAKKKLNIKIFLLVKDPTSAISTPLQNPFLLYPPPLNHHFKSPNTMSQVAPSWCLLSSTFQFWNGIPKSLIPMVFFRPVQPLHNFAHECGINIQFSGQSISSSFYPFPSVSIPFSAVSSHFD